MWGVRDVARAVQFWTSAIAYRPRDEPSDDWAVLVPITGAGTQLALMLVDNEPTGHRRHHLDLYSTDQAEDTERLIELGAHRVDWKYEDDADYIVLADPDGNLFCVVQVDG